MDIPPSSHDSEAFPGVISKLEIAEIPRSFLEEGRLSSPLQSLSPLQTSVHAFPQTSFQTPYQTPHIVNSNRESRPTLSIVDSPSKKPASRGSVQSRKQSLTSDDSKPWMFVLGSESISDDFDIPQPSDTNSHDGQVKSPPISGRREQSQSLSTSADFSLPVHVAEPLSLIKFENIRTRTSVDSSISQSSRRSSGIMEKIVLRRESNESTNTNDSYFNTPETTEGVHTKSTVAARMKQLQGPKNPLTRQNSKMLRYQQMRTLVQKVMREQGLVSYMTVESESIPYTKQINLGMYSDDNLMKRENLRNNERILEIIERWWKGTKLDIIGNREKVVSRSTYISLSMTIYYVLMMMGNSGGDPSMSQPTLMDARKCAEQDWESDSKGGAYLSKTAFFDSIFELADLWCESTRLLEYVNFLEKMYRRVFEDPNLPPLLRRHLNIQNPKPIQSLEEPDRKVVLKKKKKKREEPLPEIDWSEVKAIGLAIPDKEESDPESLDSPTREDPPDNEDLRISHDILNDYLENEIKKPHIEMKKSPMKPIIQRKHVVRRTTTEENPPKQEPDRNQHIIKLKESELKEIAQYLHNKEALKLILALLRQGDQYILEKTIFDRLLNKLESGFEDNLHSSLFQLMKEKVIPERYQSIMSRMNKLNPKQFVTVLRKGLEKREKSSDKIILDMSEVILLYKVNEDREDSRTPSPTRPLTSSSSFRTTSRAASRSESRSASRPLTRSETRQLLRKLESRGAISQNEERIKRIEERRNRPRTAPLKEIPSRKLWRDWKEMVNRGLELTNPTRDNELISLTNDNLSEESGDNNIQDHSSMLSSERRSRRRERSEQAAKHSSTPNPEDEVDDYSMFSELSDLKGNTDLWSESYDSDDSSDQSSIDSNALLAEMRTVEVEKKKKQHKPVTMKFPTFGGTTSDKAGNRAESIDISLDEVKVFRVDTPTLLKNSYFSPSRIKEQQHSVNAGRRESEQSPMRNSWLPKRASQSTVPPLPSPPPPSTRAHSQLATPTSPSFYYHLYRNDNESNSKPQLHDMENNRVHSRRHSSLDQYLSSMEKTEMTALQRHSTVSLVSLHPEDERDVEMMKITSNPLQDSKSKSLPPSRPTSAISRVHFKKRPITAYHGRIPAYPSRSKDTVSRSIEGIDVVEIASSSHTHSHALSPSRERHQTKQAFTSFEARGQKLSNQYSPRRTNLHPSPTPSNLFF